MSTATIRVGRINLDAILDQAEPKMRALGNNVARRMQRVVPKRTWALHDSIKVEQRRSGSKLIVNVVVGEDAYYWDLVERGTSRAPAQPFMRPAFLQSNAGDFRVDPGSPARHGTRRPRA